MEGQGEPQHLVSELLYTLLDKHFLLPRLYLHRARQQGRPEV